MRKHPPVNCHLGSVRVPVKDTVLAGFKIPKGVPVVCNSWGMVRDPKIFPQPEVSTTILSCSYPKINQACIELLSSCTSA